MINGKKLIALCASRIYDLQIFNYIQLLNRTLQEDSCALMIFTINNDIYWEEEMIPAETYIFDLLPYEDLDCILILDEKIKSHTISNRIIDRAKDADVPVIIVDGHYEGTTQVSFDYASGFETVTRHIIEHHQVKRPHIMAGLPDNFFSDQRIEIFKKVLAENGIPFDNSMLSYGHFWADPTKAAMQKILKRDVIPDAIICANDIMAINVIDSLQKAGYRVPEDVLVSGFDGYDEVFFTTPKITTASCVIPLLAEASGKLALRAAAGEEIQDTFIEPFFIPNESCGCESHASSTQSLVSSFNNNFYRHQDDMRILYEISSNMETSSSLWEMASHILNYKTWYSLTIINRNIFELKDNYFMTESDRDHAPDFHLLFDSEYAEMKYQETGRQDEAPLPKELFFDTEVNTKETVLAGNYRDRIIKLTDSKYPLIFSALDYMNKPIGFECFFFPDFTITDYSRASIVTNAISMGIGTFINLQYQRHLLKQMDDMYKHDALTGLYNRLGFQKVFQEVRNKEENQGKPFTMIMSDLDGLKYINDNFGHAEGDRAIAAVASALTESCPKEALSARFGGDELFSVIIGECDAEAIAKQIDFLLEDFNLHSDLPYTITTSTGIYTSTLGDDLDIMKALKTADDKMYTIKRLKKEQPKPGEAG